LIDFHCHLDLYPDPVATIKAADEARVYVLSVTTTPKAWRKTAALAKGCPRIRTALGLHPQIAHERESELPLFEGLISETHYVGEIGLDGSPELRIHAGVQKRVFARVLRVSARHGGRILSIHSRRAADEVLECLRAEPDAGIPILHWFSGSKSQLKAAVAQGCWFSVGLPMLRSGKGRSLVADMPKDRILTETDGPFANDGGRTLTPTDAARTVAALGELWGISAEATDLRISANLKALTSFPSSAATNSIP
jgi:TatD DNase family protein